MMIELVGSGVTDGGLFLSESIPDRDDSYALIIQIQMSPEGGSFSLSNVDDFESVPMLGNGSFLFGVGPKTGIYEWSSTGDGETVFIWALFRDVDGLPLAPSVVRHSRVVEEFLPPGRDSLSAGYFWAAINMFSDGGGEYLFEAGEYPFSSGRFQQGIFDGGMWAGTAHAHGGVPEGSYGWGGDAYFTNFSVVTLRIGDISRGEDRLPNLRHSQRDDGAPRASNVTNSPTSVQAQPSGAPRASVTNSYQ